MAKLRYVHCSKEAECITQTAGTHNIFKYTIKEETQISGS
jgi:hypothetical protein